ncbi:MAG: hypothetical protein Q8942_10835 [Bacillota bacterium]|nr:hypothetical protein [Bacillota bacterium]
MKRQFKTVVSVLLCFLMIFGQLTPMTATTGMEQGSQASVSDSVYNNTADNEKVGLAANSVSNPVISGEVILPAGYTAPASGLSVNLYASNGTSTQSVAVNIPGGLNKANYSLNVTTGSGYVIYYQTSNASYMGSMYYGYQGMVRNKSSAALLNITDDMAVNITLTPMRKISGKLIFPGNTTASTFKVYAVSDMDSRVSDTITLDKGEAEYSIIVPPNSVGSGYTVRYEAINDNTVISPGYYSFSGIQRFANMANLIDVSSGDKTDLNLEVQKKKLISGTISLPEGVALPASTLNVTMYASYGSDTSKVDITLTKDSPSKVYNLYVPDGSGYKVWYQLSNVEQFMPNGYYSSIGTVSDSAKAGLINVINGDRTDVNIKLISKRAVSGIVKLPNGLKAPADGIDVTVRVANSSNSGSANVKIKPDSDFENFTVYVPEGIGYKLSYETKNVNYTPNGFYNISKTVLDSNSATTFDLGSNEDKTLNITLIAKRLVSGKIQLPSGTVQDDEVDYKITVSNGSDTGTAEVKMLTGESSVSYSALVAPGTNYIVQCDITKAGITYIKTTYYSAAGTVYNRSFAKGIDTTAGNQPGIDFVLLEKRKVRGTVSLPENMTMPYDAYFTYTDKDDGRVYKTIIKQGSRSADYTFYYNPGVHTVYYEMSPNNLMVEKGYYSKTGTVLDESAATPVDVTTGDAVGVDFVFILKKIISGKVMLQDGKAADSYISALVKARGARGEATCNVTFSQGDKEASYTLAVPPGSDYKLWYENVTGSSNLITKMF